LLLRRASYQQHQENKQAALLLLFACLSTMVDWTDDDDAQDTRDYRYFDQLSKSFPDTSQEVLRWNDFFYQAPMLLGYLTATRNDRRVPAGRIMCPQTQQLISIDTPYYPATEDELSSIAAAQASYESRTERREAHEAEVMARSR
jgi:hypothetical protein